LNLIASQRMPLWYSIWDGNQNDDHTYLPDWKGLLHSGLELGNTILIFDRKACNYDTMLELCKSYQAFVGAHPWTVVAKQTWQQVWGDLQTGKRSWSEVDYVARNVQKKAVQARPQYKVCEVQHDLLDESTGTTYPLRWIFSWSSRTAELDARQRQEALERGEKALQRVARLVGKYDYTQRERILQRIETALKAVGEYFLYELSGSEENQDWQLTWSFNNQAIAEAANWDGIALICSNVPPSQLSAGEVFKKYKQQVSIEQTIDFIKSQIQVRPMWLHCPQRLAGLTLLIMLAVLIASLIEYRVRQEIAKTQQPLQGLMPENRNTLFPTAEKLLKAFQDYSFVITRLADGIHQLHFPKPRPIQKQILDILELLPSTPS
jgi:transposase